MGLEELIKTLRANQQSQIDEIWQSAKAEAASLHEQTAGAVSGMTVSHTDSLVCSCQKSLRTIVSEAQIRAREIKLMALESLRDSLHKAAVKQLHHLRNDAYDMIFKKLVQELPPQNWETIIVHPEDISIAKNFFKSCDIQADPTISGGMVALSAEGRIAVNNTLEKRLEGRWATLFPAIAREIEKEYVESGSITESTEV